MRLRLTNLSNPNLFHPFFPINCNKSDLLVITANTENLYSKLPFEYLIVLQ